MKWFLTLLLLSCVVRGDDVVWRNWNGQVRAVPRQIYEPRNLTEIQSIILDAKANNIEVKVTGASHSFSEIAQTNGYLIKTHYLNATSVENTAQKLVRVQTGVKVKDLDDFLETKGWVLPTGTVLDAITVGGSVVAGCHGAGKQYSIISDLLTEIRIVDGNGVLKTYSGLTLNHAKVTLGLLGVVYDMVLKVEASRNVQMKSVSQPYATTITGPALKSLFDAHDSLEIYYFPFSTTVQVRTTTASSQPVTFNFTQHVLDGLATIEAGWMYAPIFAADPNAVYYVGSSGFNIFTDTEDVRPLRYAVHYGYGIEDGPSSGFNPEYAIGFHNNPVGFKKVADAIDDGVALINHYFFTKGQAPCTYGINVRFTKASSSTLSPANVITPYVMWIDLLVSIDAAGAEEFMDDVYQLYTSAKYNGAPHWPKDWNNIPNNQNVNLMSFLRHRKLTNVDPNNLFINDALFRLINNKFTLVV